MRETCLRERPRPGRGLGSARSGIKPRSALPKGFVLSRQFEDLAFQAVEAFNCRFNGRGSRGSSLPRVR